MDLLLLRAVAAEAAARLVEQELLRAAHLGESRYLLRFAGPDRANLLVSCRPDLPRVHLLPRGERVPEASADRFAALLDGEIAGGVLTAIEIAPWDRVLTLRFRLPRRADGARERAVVIEILGRSSNLLVHDERGIVLGYARELRSVFRAPATGGAYAPPRGREICAGLPTGPEAADEIARRFPDAAAFLENLSPRLAADLRAAEAGGVAAPRERLQEILSAMRDGRFAPIVYSTRPLAALREGERPGRDDLFALALPLLEPGRLVSTPFASPSEAAAAALGLLERLRDFAALAEHHRAIVRHEIDRLEGLSRKLEGELERARGSDRFRVQGEALLAGLGAARLEGDEAVVPDPYDPSGRSLRVPVDPALPLQDSAQALFARFKKGKRATGLVASRLAAVRERLERWRALEEPARELRGAADIERLREAMTGLGIVHAPRPATRAGAPRPAEAPARVRRHLSPDGLVILVGKSGEENDTLTFKVASPWDFWLHAADHPGAHVVVKNPRRLKTIPEATLRRAAEIAAWYSGARESGKVEVHYTQRKHVHKRRGTPKGQVLLRRFRSIQVVPRLPAPSTSDV
jgi:predicted ribosome quality control (RQC) complex YloA/Tae2 family protein